MKSKHRYNHRSTSLASAVAIALLGSSTVALAEQLVLEEVIVTAQKREEMIQDVPMAITAYSGENLDELGVVNLTDVGRFASGVASGANFVQSTPSTNSSRLIFVLQT